MDQRTKQIRGEWKAGGEGGFYFHGFDGFLAGTVTGFKIRQRKTPLFAKRSAAGRVDQFAISIDLIMESRSESR